MSDIRKLSKGSQSSSKLKPQSTGKKSNRSGSKSPSKRTITSVSQESLSRSRDQVGMNSSAEVEDLSGQGLTALNPKLFQSKLVISHVIKHVTMLKKGTNFVELTLRKVILSSNNLRSIPSSIADLVNLEYLDLSNNPLRVRDVDDSNCLPLEMRLLKNLRFLSLRECNLRQIPTTVWLCQSLQQLDLSRNKLGLVVPDIGNLVNLMRLNLVQCDLSTLPGELMFCADLVEIDLMGNRIESLPESLRDLKKLEILRMSFGAFSSLLDSYMEQLISKCI